MKAVRLVSLTFLFFVATETATACVCALGVTTQEAISRSDIVFRGEIVAHEWGSAVFRVHEYWKGNLKRTVKVQWRHQTGGDCNGFSHDQLKIGNELLVFATKRRFGGYRTSICLPTKLVAKATKVLDDLGPGNPPAQKRESAR